MAWTITNNAKNIEFLDSDTGINTAIDKINMHITFGGDTNYVMVHNTIAHEHSINKLQVNYTNVTTPTFASAQELYDQLNTWKNETQTVTIDLSGEDLAKETTLEAIRVLTASLDGKDYSTETTLAALKLVADSIKLGTDNLDVALSTRASEATLLAANVLLASINGKDFATETTLLAIEGLLTLLEGKDFATETTQAGIKAQTDKLTFTGNDLNVNASFSPGISPQIISTVNATETPLGIGGIFTGTFEDNEAVGVMVHVEADQDGTIFFDFDQQTTGTNVDTFPFTGFSHTANIPSFHVALKGRQRFRVRFENTSGVAQTFLRISTYYGQYREPNTPVGVTINDDTDAIVTHSVLTGKDDTGVFRNIGGTPSGNLKNTLHDAQTNSRQIVDLNGAAKVGEAIILSGDVLYGQPLSSILWVTLGVNGGTTTGGAGEQILETNTAADGEMCIQSTKRSRFMISQFNINHFGIQLDAAGDLTDPNTIFEWGSVDFIDDTGVSPVKNLTPNGIFIRVQGNAVEPVWSIVSVKNGVETSVPFANWNGTNASLFNKMPSLSVYEMQYNAGTAFFFQNGNFLHRLAPPNAETYAGNYNFPVSLRIRNINGNTNNRQLKARAAGTYRLGEERGELIARAITANTLIKTGAGYVGKASLSRTGSSGGSGTAIIYDGIDATGIVIGRIDVGGDDVKGVVLDGTYSNGLYVTISGSGTNTLTINFE